MEGLVDEVPVVATLVVGIFAYQVPVFLQSASGVAHGVVVLALYERLGVGRILTVFGTFVGLHIHRAEDVGVVTFSCAFPVDGARRVEVLYPFVGCREVGTIGRLVAERPHNHRRMVVERAHVVLVALHDLHGEVGLAGLAGEFVPEAVAFLVGFCRDIESVFVAEIIPNGIIGIVAGAHGVDIEPLHDLDVLQHTFARDDVASIGIHLVPVGTLDEHGLSVDKQLLVFDLHLAESHALRDGSHHVASLVLHGCHKGVEIGSLGGPCFHVLDIEAHFNLLVAFERGLRFSYSNAVLVVERIFHRRVPHSVGFYAEHTVLIGFVEVGGEQQVGDLYTWVTAVEVAFTRYATQSPEVLILTERSVAPAEHLEGDEILARFDQAGDVELGRYLRVFGISGKLAVDVEVDTGGDAAEMGDHLAAFPVGGNVYRAAVGTHMVILRGNSERLVPVELIAPGKAYIEIFRITIAIDLPNTRHRHGLPR